MSLSRRCANSNDDQDSEDDDDDVTNQEMTSLVADVQQRLDHVKSLVLDNDLSAFGLVGSRKPRKYAGSRPEM